MDKPKRKNDEPNRWERFLDTVLLAKPFVWKVDMSPEECAEQLRKLAKQTGPFDNISREVDVLDLYNQTYDFEVSLIAHGRNPITNARATGHIFVDNGIEKTIIQGKTRIGSILLLWYLVGFASLFISLLELLVNQTQSRQVLWEITLLFAGFALVAFLVLVAQYRKFCHLLRNTFSPESKSKKKKHHETE